MASPVVRAATRGGGPPGPLAAMLATPGLEVLSLDVFDTVLLRDGSTETGRLAAACATVANSLGVDARTLTRLRWLSHDNGYRSVAIERPDGDVTLAAMCRAAVAPLGLGVDAAELLAAAEVRHDATRLTGNRLVVDTIRFARDQGLRVIALSDTPYSESDLRTLFGLVLGEVPFDAVYTSSDLGATKHSGSAFGRVVAQEDRAPGAFLHAGDSRHSDLDRPRAAGWNALHLPRGVGHATRRLFGQVRAVPVRRTRSR